MAKPSDLSIPFTFLASSQIPPELVLQTIQHIPFRDGALITALRSAHPRLHALFSTYEQSLTCCFMRKELRHAQVDFPCSRGGDLNIDWLVDCVRNYDTIDDVMDALCSEHNFNAVLRHNVSLANAGLLLLHRISLLGWFCPLPHAVWHMFLPGRLTNLKVVEKHKEKLCYIQSLQRDGLVAVYLVLHHSTLSARYHGSGWINQRTYGRFMDANQVELRSELEFCFAEAALSIGPVFISDTLLHHDRSDCEVTLLNFYHEYGTHDWEWPCWGNAKGEFEPPRTQGPLREESSKERSLFTTLLECLGEQMQCSLSDVRARVERELESTDHRLAYLSLGGKKRLLQGKN
jgi:hypothetical protein